MAVTLDRSGVDQGPTLDVSRARVEPGTVALQRPTEEAPAPPRLLSIRPVSHEHPPPMSPLNMRPEAAAAHSPPRRPVSRSREPRPSRVRRLPHGHPRHAGRRPAPAPGRGPAPRPLGPFQDDSFLDFVNTAKTRPSPLPRGRQSPSPVAQFPGAFSPRGVKPKPPHETIEDEKEQIIIDLMQLQNQLGKQLPRFTMASDINEMRLQLRLVQVERDNAKGVEFYQESEPDADGPDGVAEPAIQSAERGPDGPQRAPRRQHAHLPGGVREHVQGSTAPPASTP